MEKGLRLVKNSILSLIFLFSFVSIVKSDDQSKKSLNEMTKDELFQLVIQEKQKFIDVATKYMDTLNETKEIIGKNGKFLDEIKKINEELIKIKKDLIVSNKEKHLLLMQLNKKNEKLLILMNTIKNDVIKPENLKKYEDLCKKEKEIMEKMKK